MGKWLNNLIQNTKEVKGVFKDNLQMELAKTNAKHIMKLRAKRSKLREQLEEIEAELTEREKDGN